MMKFLIEVVVGCSVLLRAQVPETAPRAVIVGQVLARHFGVADIAPITEGQKWVPLLVSRSQRSNADKYVKIRYEYWPLPAKGRELPFDDSLTIWRFEAVRDTSCDGTLGDMRFVQGTPDAGVKADPDQRISALVPFKGFSREQLNALPDSIQLECYAVVPEDIKRMPKRAPSSSQAVRQ